MGYDVSIELKNVVIPGDKVAAATYALKRLCLGYDDPHISEEESAAINADSDPDVERSVPGAAPRFCWVDGGLCVRFLEEGNIVAAIREWRYGARIDFVSDIEKLAQPDLPLPALTINFFHGSKWGDDEVFWNCLGPYLTQGAVITVEGEDGAYWSYRKEGLHLLEENGRIVWI